MYKQFQPRLMLLLVVVAQSFFASAQDQSIQHSKKRPNLGVSFNKADWDTENIFKDSIYGFSAMYWQGITSHLDYSIRFNGLFSNKTVNNVISSNRMSSELETGFHLKAFRDRSVINPFLSAGIGIGNYIGKQWRPYAPLGAGLQFNIQNELYLLFQGSYRLSFDKNKNPNTLLYSAGLTKSLWGKPKPKDSDGDGVLDKDDKCPTMFGMVKYNGCPAPDSDGDGLNDEEDKCPNQKGTAKYQGCPVPDSDGDGLNDEEDKCPNQKGTAKYQGCPIPDSDGDELNDEEDKCPSVKGLARYQGCPVPDSDNDGINDEEDKCPNLIGVRENSGCPVITEALKEKVDVAAQNILFVTGSAKLQKSSYKGLDEVAKIMSENPGMSLSIAGHTDNVGSDQLNQKLSESRAAAVKAYFVSKGIDERKISSTGFGESKSIADNKTPKGRKQNRRVELLLSFLQ